MGPGTGRSVGPRATPMDTLRALAGDISDYLASRGELLQGIAADPAYAPRAASGREALAQIINRTPEEGRARFDEVFANPFMGAMPVAGIFAGMGAKTADLAKLRVAEDMAGKGAEPEAIRAATAPYSSQGIAPEDMIVLPRSGGVQASVSLPVRPPSEDVERVAEAWSSFARVVGNRTMPVRKLSGGVSLNDPEEVARIDDLVAKMSGPDGYISRIVVDQGGNVIEGQHRLEALRRLGVQKAPVIVVEDMADGMPVEALRQAAADAGMRRDNINQMVFRALEAVRDAGSVDKALTDYQMPAQFQPAFEAVLKAIATSPAN